MRVSLAVLVVVQACGDTPSAVDVPSAIAAVTATSVTGVVGQSVNPPPAVKVTRSGGEPLAAVKVTFAVASGGGSVTGAEATTNSSGVATVGGWVLGTIAGPNVLTAFVAGLTAIVSFEAQAAAGPPATMALQQGNNQFLANGGTLPIDPSVKVTDASGNGIAAVSVTFSVTQGDGIIFTGTTAVNQTTVAVPTSAAGVAAVRWGLTGVKTTHALTASTAGLTGSPVTFSATSTPDPVVLENLASNAMRTWMNTHTGMTATGPLSTQARTFSASWTNFNMYFYSSVDNPSSPAEEWHRNTRAWQNSQSAPERSSVSWFWSGGLANGTSIASNGFAGVLSMTTDVLHAIRKAGAVIRNTPDTKRAEAIAVLMQGAALMGFALNYDKAFILDENATPSATPPYANRKALRDAAVARLTEAAAVASANSFSTPAAWTNGRTYTNTDVARIANTMAAMTVAFYPRDAGENAAVNWAQVSTLAAAGLSSGTPIDFALIGDGCGAWCSETLNWFNSIDVGRVSTRVAALLHPATQTDPWPTVGNPRPNSPDRRLGDGSFGDASMQSTFGTVSKTASAGTDFAWSSLAIFSAARGNYHQSNIAHIRYDATGTQNFSGVYGGFGTMPVITASLNDLLWAEASLRTGDLAQAATLINKTRVTRGGLPPAMSSHGAGSDANGPCTSAGTLAKDGSACTLMSMLLYEFEIELLGLGAAPFYVQRRLPVLAAGGRTMQGLLPGTPRELPVPFSVLSARAEPLYTWGGTNAANSPTPP